MSGAILQLQDVCERREVTDSADVVIVGTGAAGATAARVLTEAGLDVILVEEGEHVPTAELRSDMLASFRRLWRDMGFQVAEGRAFTPILQGRCVGGTTAINGAIIHRLPEVIHQLWCRDHGAGDFLPYAKLQRVYDQLDEELAVGAAPEAILGGNNRLMRAGIEACGWQGNLIRRNVRGCEGTSHCNQGCPNARRQSMNNSYVPRAVASGARVYATCRAEGLLRERGRAAGVVGRFRLPLGGPPGPRLRVHARRAVIVAASAIQTPLLLARAGVGGSSGLLGQRLQAHPGGAIMGLFDEPVRPWFGATQGYESTHFWPERMKFEAVSMPLELGAARLPGIGPALMRQLGAYGHVATWGVQVRARAHGSVRPGLFGGTSIRYDMTDEDVRTLKLGLRRVSEAMFAAGARELLPGIHGLPERITSLDGLAALESLPDDPRRFHCIAAHLFGTAVMGTDPRGSVVAPDGSVHGLPGLYVADSSPFPTNFGVNPQHTICAYAWLVAERLAGG